jgi:hypothetical protein
MYLLFEKPLFTISPVHHHLCISIFMNRQFNYSMTIFAINKVLHRNEKKYSSIGGDTASRYNANKYGILYRLMDFKLVFLKRIVSSIILWIFSRVAIRKLIISSLSSGAIVP